MENFTFQDAQTFVEAWNLVASSNNLGLVRRLHEAVGQSICELFKVWEAKGKKHYISQSLITNGEDAVIRELHRMLVQEGIRTELLTAVKKRRLGTSENT